MDFGLLLGTIRHLRFIQLFYQVKYRLIKPAYVAFEAPDGNLRFQGSRFRTEPVPKYKCIEGETFSFLNLEHQFAGWNFTDNGMLWAYNQNYFDWINQEGYAEEEGCKWIDRFISDVCKTEDGRRQMVGLDPYPTALRCINWVKFFCRFPNSATKLRDDALYSQLRLLEKKLEYHLLGNHLLEDAYALYIGASFFNDNRLLKKAEKLILGQLKEQVLPDGAHYEQSPMYHCLLLDRLLDCINIRRTDALVGYAQKMLGHLASITWKDGAIPMLGDSAKGIAPLPERVFDYAQRLGLEWGRIPMKACGYRKMVSDPMEAIVDVGNMTATYQPGHSHADTLNYELRIHGKSFVVDTGISTYDKTGRRQIERSTVAHNCVSPDGKNSSEVWGGFRVGKRCHCVIAKDTGNMVIAKHDGFDKACCRKFEMKDGAFYVEDWYEGDAVSYIHLAEGAYERRIMIDGAFSIESKPWQYSIEYNKFMEGKVIEIRFKGNCSYTIQ
jgi:hypothetical protein